MSAGGFSELRLRRMRDVMAGHVARSEVPGLVAMVSRRGEVHLDAFGMKAVGGNSPVERDSIFRITSMTKPITAVAAMILLEECKLRLDEPVDKWLPELANRKVLKRVNGPIHDTVPALRPISVRDLLTFRMGLGMILASPDDYPILKAVQEQGIVGFGAPEHATPHSADEWLRRLGGLPLMHQPGEQWMYNTAYYVLGVLIARVAGVPLETFLRERIFEPLAMKDTGFSVEPAKLKRLTSCYWFDSQAAKLELLDGGENSMWRQAPVFADAGAGLVSTVDDYLAFSQMLLNFGRAGLGGKTRILSRPSVEMMTTDQLTHGQRAEPGFFPGHWDNRGFGFGVSMVTHRDSATATPGQYGWDGGFGSSWRIDPKEQLIGVIMTARTFDSPILPAVCQDFWASCYQAIDD